MSAPTCPRCDVDLVWTDWGYRCPECFMFVALPRKDAKS